MPPPSPDRASGSAAPKPSISEERLALLAAAERERVLTSSSRGGSRRVALIFMLVAVVGFFAVAMFTAPEPPESSAQSGDSRAVALALASGVDTAAAPTGLSSRAWVQNVWPTGVVGALSSAAPLGLSAADVIVEGQTARLRAIGWQADLTYLGDRAELVFPNGSRFCVAFAEAAKAPSKVSEKGC